MLLVQLIRSSFTLCGHNSNWHKRRRSNVAKGLVAALGTIAFMVGATAAPPPIRILPLGDSITYGYDVPGGYRLPLYQVLTNAGYNVDFTGTQTGNGAADLPDPDHEGHPG